MKQPSTQPDLFDLPKRQSLLRVKQDTANKINLDKYYECEAGLFDGECFQFVKLSKLVEVELANPNITDTIELIKLCHGS